MIRIAIVEDEIKFIDLIKDYLKRYGKEKDEEIQISVFNDGEDIVEGYRCQYDIILMDIQLTFMNGMTAAKMIRQQDQDVVIMFITNMSQYALKGYEVEALDYVVKPVEYFAFSQKMDKALEKCIKRRGNYLIIPTETGIHKVPVSDILYIESQKHNAIYYTKKNTYISRITLKELEHKLTDEGFYRCSKGFLVNLRKIDEVKNEECIIGNSRIPISRFKKKEFMEQFIQYVNEA